jgi:hypothetical protein
MGNGCMCSVGLADPHLLAVSSALGLHPGGDNIDRRSVVGALD